MKHPIKSVICIAACILTGAPTGAWAQKSSRNDITSPTSDRLYYGPCIAHPEFNGLEGGDKEFIGGLLALAIPALVSRGLERFGNALRKAGEAKERQFKVNRVIEDDPGDAAPCIQFIRGRFYNGEPSGGKFYNFPAPNNLDPNALRAAGVFLVDEPDIMMEFVRQESQDTSVVSYGLGFLAYNKTFFGRLSGDRRKPKGGGKGGRFLVAQINFSEPGGEENNAVGGNIDIGYVDTANAPRILPVLGGTAGRKGFEIESEWFANINTMKSEKRERQAGLNAEYTRLASYEKIAEPQDKIRGFSSVSASRPVLVSAPGPDPRGSAPLQNPSTSTETEQSSDENDASTVQTKRPFNLTLKIVEFQEENKFLSFLSDVFDDTSASLQDAILDDVDPARRAEALRTRLQARNEVLVGFQNKFVAAEQKYYEYCNSEGNDKPTVSDWLTMSKDAYIAQLDANLEAQVVGVPIPYPNPVAVSGKVPDCYKNKE